MNLSEIDEKDFFREVLKIQIMKGIDQYLDKKDYPIVIEVFEEAIQKLKAQLDE